MGDNSKEMEKIATTIRLFEEENNALDRIKDKYRISKSEIVGNLIKKYAKEEYGAF